MLKQILLAIMMVSLFSLFTFAQEKTETETAEKKECSHSCCGTKEKSSESNLEMNIDTEVVMIWNKVCPIEGSKVNSDSPSVEFEGKVVGFCCADCGTKFEKNPSSYLKNLNDSGTRFIKS